MINYLNGNEVFSPPDQLAKGVGSEFENNDIFPERKSNKVLGKDDFLKMMLVQIKNQDPTKPFDSEKMATQMAQFSSVEQLQNIDHNLTKIELEKKPFEQLLIANLLGKSVTVDHQQFKHNLGERNQLGFHLSEDSQKINVVIEDLAGKSVYEEDFPASQAGEINLSWDGLKNNGLPADSGTYRLKVSAWNRYGEKFNVNLLKSAEVKGVSFEGSEPVLIVGDSQHMEKISIQNLASIELVPSQKKTSE